jgi:hypothetical protein
LVVGYRLSRNHKDLFVILIVILLLSLGGRLGDTVQISLAGLGDAAATLLLILLKDTNLFQSLHNLAVDTATGIDVLGRTDTSVLGGTVDLAKAANTDSLAEVDVTGNGSGADVEPIGVLRRQLAGGTGLDGVNPAW